MKIEINNAFGIRKQLIFDGENKKNIIIFGPNGSGKTSISKTFKQLGMNEFNDFGWEKDGNKNSLKINDKNMEETNYNNILIINDKTLNIPFKNDPINDYIINSNIIKTIESFYNSYDSFVAEVWGEYGNDFNNEPKNEKISNFFKKINDDNITSFLRLVNELRKSGNSNEISASKSELSELYSDYEEMTKIEKILKENKTTKLNDVFLSIDKGLKGYEDELEKAYPIMTDIVSKGMDENFGYKIKGNFEEIKNIYENIRDEVLKKGLSETDFKVFFSNISLFKKYNVKTSLKTTKNASKYILDKIKIAENKHAANIIKDKQEFDAVRGEYNEITGKYIENYNEIVEKVNSFIGSDDKLIWKIKVQKINTVFDTFKMDIYYNGVEKKWDEMNEFASTGQLRIIQLALALLNWDKYELLVIDDVMSSLDFDNSDIAIEMFAKISKPVIFLTHNFSVISKMFYNIKITNTSSLHVIDSNNINEPFTFKIKKPSEISNISKLLNSHNNLSFLETSKKSMISSVLYEYIENYIQNTYTYSLVSKENKNKIQECLKEVKNNINKYSRHWKPYETKISSFSSSLCKEKYVKEILFGSTSIFKILLKDKSDVEFVKYFADENILKQILNAESDINLIDWLSTKYFIAMKIRQKIEEFIIEKNEELKTGWGDNEIYGLGETSFNKYMEIKYKDNEKIKNQIKNMLEQESVKKLININNKLHFVNHLDNLKWIPIFEFPAHKLLEYLNIVEEIINN